MASPEPTGNSPNPILDSTHSFAPKISDSLHFDKLTPAAPPTGQPQATPTPFAPHLPRYELRSSLGRGGMGQVFQAWDTLLGREVAIKFMLRQAEAPKSAIERFRREGTILAQMDDKHIVQVFDSGEASGYLYHVMKLIPGGTLNTQASNLRTDARRVAEIFRKIALGLQHAHDRGVYHRDMKPGNVLMEGDEPLIMDFGVAKWEDADQSTQGYAIFGTFNYLAPEILDSGSTQAKASGDIWALGVMLYEMLAGERPFSGEKNDAGLFRQIRTAAPVALERYPTLVPGCDDALEAIVLKCLAKDPAQRYDSAAAVATDLDRWLHGEATANIGLPEMRLAATGISETAATVTHLLPGRPTKKGLNKAWIIALAVIVVGLGIGVAVVLAKWKTKPDEKNEEKSKSLVEEIEGGSTAILIAANGLPTRTLPEVRGLESRASLSMNQRTKIDSTAGRMLELGNEEFPFPVRIEGEVRIEEVQGEGQFGLYGARKEFPQNDGKVLHFAYVNVFGPRTPKDKLTPGTLEAIGTAFRIEPGHPGYQRLLPVDHDFKPTGPTPPEFARVGEEGFRKLVIEIRGDSFRGGHEKIQFENVDPNKVSMAFDIPELKQNYQYRKPLFGGGFGLLVFQGCAEFRNVTIRRIPK